MTASRAPLAELCLATGLGLVVAGFTGALGPRVTVSQLGATLVLLGAIKLGLREHLTGARSHGLVLAGLAGAGVLAALVLALRVAPAMAAIAALTAFVAVALLLRAARPQP